MTENETIEILKELNENYFQPDNQGEFDDVNSALEGAISALEEIQKYRGFEERLKKIYGNCPGLLEIVIKHLERHDGIDIPEPVFKVRLLTDGEVDKWEAYKKLGKPDEIKVLINRLNAVIAAQHDKLTAYIKLGTVDELREREEKQC